MAKYQVSQSVFREYVIVVEADSADMAEDMAVHIPFSEWDIGDENIDLNPTINLDELNN
jgi:hypothetical protein